MGLVKYTVIVLVLVAFTGCGGVPVNVISCSQTPSEDVVIIKNLTINPFPIEVPGSFSFSFVIGITKSLERDLRVEATIRKKFGILWLPVPCNSGSSCTYPGLCSFFQSLHTSDCPDVPRQMNIDCSRPVPAGTYGLPGCTQNVSNSMFGLQLSTLTGEYQENIRFTDPITGKEVGCFEFKHRIVDSPSS